MNKYQNGKIYKITSKQTDDVYIGSTIEPLSYRMSGHRNSNPDITMCSSRELLKYSDAIIELIEDYPCETKEELLWRERYWIENTKCVNIQLPIRTKQELIDYKKKHYEENKEHYKKYKQEFYQKNKEKYNKQNKIRYENNKEKYNKQNKIRYENNKEKYNKQNKIRYENNKERYREQCKEYYEKNKEHACVVAKKRYQFKCTEFGQLCKMF